MAQRLIRHMRSQLIAYLALFLSLGGTSIAAVQALPRNSVGSPQIQNRSIQTIDVSRRAVSALRGRRGAPGPQGLQGAKGDKGDKGDSGAQGAVGPTFGRTGASGGCNPNSATTFVVCASTGPISLPAAGRVLLVGTATWGDNASPPPNSGQCLLRADGNPAAPFSVEFGEGTATHHSQLLASIATNAVTGPLAAGVHTFTLECIELDADVVVNSATISAVLLGEG